MWDFAWKEKLGQLGQTIASKAKDIVTGNSTIHPRPPKALGSVSVQGQSYQLIQTIATGAFGTVYRAKNDFGDVFAVKRVLCRDSQRQLQFQAQLELAINLPKSQHLVTTYAGKTVEEDGNKVILAVMQLCQKETAFDLVAQNLGGSVPQQRIVQVGTALSLALKALHGEGLAHWDIKLENVLRGKDGRWKLCDFGSCSRKEYDFAKIPKSDYDSVLDFLERKTTPMYRPPELVDPYSHRLFGRQADLWMTGCVLYTLAYGRHPFVDSSQVGIAEARVGYPPGRSSKLANLIRNLLVPDPKLRLTLPQLSTYLCHWQSILEVPLNQGAAARIKFEPKDTSSPDAFRQLSADELLNLQRQIASKSSQTAAPGFVFKKEKKPQPKPKEPAWNSWAGWPAGEQAGKKGDWLQFAEGKQQGGKANDWFSKGKQTSDEGWSQFCGSQSKQKKEELDLLQFFSSPSKPDSLI